MSKLIVVPKVSRRPAVAVSTAMAVPVLPRRRRTRNRRARSSLVGQSSGFLQAYSSTLNDPFEFEGVKLGYDCFLPTTDITAYCRSSFVVNADGSFSARFFPDVTQMVQLNNGPSGTAPGASFWLAAQNIAAATANLSEARVVSGGMRLFALFPETSAPGVLFSGIAPDFSVQSYNASTTATLIGLPGSKLGIGSRGASVVLRPYDNDSYAFYTYPIQGYPTSSIPTVTSGYIAGTGFPVGTVIWVEAIMNIEGIARTALGALATPSDSVPNASTFFPSPGQLFTAVQRLLTPANIMDAAVGVSQLGSGNHIGAARTFVGSLTRNFGQGSNYNRSVMRNGVRNSIMIEEIKEDQGSFVSLRRLP